MSLRSEGFQGTDCIKKTNCDDFIGPWEAWRWPLTHILIMWQLRPFFLVMNTENDLKSLNCSNCSSHSGYWVVETCLTHNFPSVPPQTGSQQSFMNSFMNKWRLKSFLSVDKGPDQQRETLIWSKITCRQLNKGDLFLLMLFDEPIKADIYSFCVSLHIKDSHSFKALCVFIFHELIQ